VAPFETLYHVILGSLALAKFMAIPNHTYLILKMLALNGAISIHGDVKTSNSCDSENINLSEALERSNNAILVADSVKKIPPVLVSIPKNDSATKLQLKPGQEKKTIPLQHDDPDKTALISTGLDQA
jgi:hypothetical protein